MAGTFRGGDIYAGDVRLRLRCARDDGDPNDRLTGDAIWPGGGARRTMRSVSSAYRRAHGLDSAIAVARASADRIAEQVRRGVFSPEEPSSADR